MKKIIIGAYIVLMAGVACTPKASPSAVAASAVPEASAVSSDEAAISAGQVIFTTKCTKCHAAKTEAVTSKSYDELRPVLTSMVKKAKLNNEEIQQVSAYVYANSKK
ncbi:hypothetical protein A8C56_18300 [Niabella ginsenosidivorans]|uniref:Cytochrome c domain-containing protein n=1 Tax=Niabella ginsenosidivorans TaxID=1176587 RepID=A0A1A9I4V7_9BACT|nr:cytochrome c [Niabella ginsenosidivorans]ANH82666.1 hypothetical protein A8C56_18300 [Niabella ginsenosidivorans]